MIQKLPVKVGEPEVLAKKFGRQLRIVRYCHPDGHEEEYSHCHADAHPSIVLPITPKLEVVAQHEFRYGIGKVLLEVSGGNGKPGQTLEDVARAELAEETGYVPGELVLLNREVFPDPATLTFPLALFLAKDCVPGAERRPERGEYIQIELIPIPDWFRRIYYGEIKDLKTIAATMLAMPHLGLTIDGLVSTRHLWGLESL